MRLPLTSLPVLVGLATACGSTQDLSAWLEPLADATINNDERGNHGADPLLHVGYIEKNGVGHLHRSYLKFDLQSLQAVDGRGVRLAYLLAHDVDTQTSTGFGCVIRAVSAPWTESGLTWTIQPAVKFKLYATVGIQPGTKGISWDLTDLVRETLDGGVPDSGWQVSTNDKPGPVTRAFTVKSKEHPAGPAFELMVDLYEMLLEGEIVTGVADLEVSGTRPGIEHYVYGGTKPTTPVHVPDPPGTYVELDDFQLITSGISKSDGTYSIGVGSLAVRFPGATTIYFQIVARDGDYLLISNRLELQP